MTDRVVMIDHNEAARQAAERKLAEEQSGESVQFATTIPGGKYATGDGRFVDAHGREIDEAGDLVGEPQSAPASFTMQVGGPEVTDAAKAQANESDAEAWRKDMIEQRRESMDNPVEGAPYVAFSTMPALEDEEVDDAGTKTGRKVARKTKRAKK